MAKFLGVLTINDLKDATNKKSDGRKYLEFR